MTDRLKRSSSSSSRSGYSSSSYMQQQSSLSSTTPPQSNPSNISYNNYGGAGTSSLRRSGSVRSFGSTSVESNPLHQRLLASSPPSQAPPTYGSTGREDLGRSSTVNRYVEATGGQSSRFGPLARHSTTGGLQSRLARSQRNSALVAHPSASSNVAATSSSGAVDQFGANLFGWAPTVWNWFVPGPSQSASQHNNNTHSNSATASTRNKSNKPVFLPRTTSLAAADGVMQARSQSQLGYRPSLEEEEEEEPYRAPVRASIDLSRESALGSIDRPRTSLDMNRRWTGHNTRLESDMDSGATATGGYAMAKTPSQTPRYYTEIGVRRPSLKSTTKPPTSQQPETPPSLANSRYSASSLASSNPTLSSGTTIAVNSPLSSTHDSFDISSYLSDLYPDAKQRAPMAAAYLQSQLQQQQQQQQQQQPQYQAPPIGRAATTTAAFRRQPPTAQQYPELDSRPRSSTPTSDFRIRRAGTATRTTPSNLPLSARTRTPPPPPLLDANDPNFEHAVMNAPEVLPRTRSISRGRNSTSNSAIQMYQRQRSQDSVRYENGGAPNNLRSPSETMAPVDDGIMRELMALKMANAANSQAALAYSQGNVQPQPAMFIEPEEEVPQQSFPQTHSQIQRRSSQPFVQTQGTVPHIMMHQYQSQPQTAQQYFGQQVGTQVAYQTPYDNPPAQLVYAQLPQQYQPQAPQQTPVAPPRSQQPRLIGQPIQVQVHYKGDGSQVVPTHNVGPSASTLRQVSVPQGFTTSQMIPQQYSVQQPLQFQHQQHQQMFYPNGQLTQSAQQIITPAPQPPPPQQQPQSQPQSQPQQEQLWILPPHERNGGNMRQTPSSSTATATTISPQTTTLPQQSPAPQPQPQPQTTIPAAAPTQTATTTWILPPHERNGGNMTNNTAIPTIITPEATPKPTPPLQPASAAKPAPGFLTSNAYLGMPRSSSPSEFSDISAFVTETKRNSLGPAAIQRPAVETTPKAAILSYSPEPAEEEDVLERGRRMERPLVTVKEPTLVVSPSEVTSAVGSAGGLGYNSDTVSYMGIPRSMSPGALSNISDQ